MISDANSNSAPKEMEDWQMDELSPDTESQWRLDEDGVYNVPEGLGEDDKEKFIFQPVLVLERVKDIDTRRESVKLGWIDSDEQHSCIVSRSTISDTGRLRSLADSGLAVHAGNAKLLMQYLMYLLDFHKANIPIRYVVSSCGWKTVKGCSFFMIGREPIGSDIPSICTNPDNGGSGILGAFGQDGDIEPWIQVARKLGEHPIAAFGLAAAFLPPLLNDLGVAQNPIVDYSGLPSTGKSTILRFVASVWGYPPR